MRPALHIIANAQSTARCRLLPWPPMCRNRSRGERRLCVTGAAMSRERAISCDGEPTGLLCVARLNRCFWLQCLHLSSALSRGMKAAQLPPRRTAHEVRVAMEKENREMYRISPHMPAWRARLTAAALVGVLGCAGGPTLLNVRFGSGATRAS